MTSPGHLQAVATPSVALAVPRVKLWAVPSAHPSTDSRVMRIASTTLAVLLMLIGGIWFLQGINILPGSFMTGQTKWAVYGGILLVVGLAVLIRARRVGR